MENSERLGRQTRPSVEPVSSFLTFFSGGTALPLVGRRTDILTSMPYPGIELGTFGTSVGIPNHCTIWSALIGRR